MLSIRLLIMMKTYTNVLLITVAALLATTGCAPKIINIKTYSSNKLALKQLHGPADAVMGDYAVMAYEARESAGQFQMACKQFNEKSLGIGVSKDAPRLKAAVTDALRKIIETRAYNKALVMWAVAEGETDPPPAPATVSAASEVPQLIDGELKVGMELSYPPMEFFDEFKNEAGVDVEIAKALAEELGVKVSLVDMPFDSLFDAVETEKVDIILSAITITEERSTRIDFIPYLSMGTGILVKKGNPLGIRKTKDMCGYVVAVQEATSQLSILKSQSCDGK